MREYKILLIIGNGFDLNLELPTRYSDFLESEHFKKHLNFKHFENAAIDEHDRNIFNYLQRQKNLKGWVDVEQELKKYASNQRVEYHREGHGLISMQNASDSQIRSSYTLLCTELKNYLTQDLYYLDIDRSALALDILEQVSLCEQNSIVTFNYTRLDRLSNYISKKCKNIPVIYIHGNIDDDNIILGFQRNEDIAPGYEYMIKTRNPNYNSCRLSERMKEADEVVVFGHSLGSTDDFYFKEYFNYVSQNKCDKTLTLFTYDRSSRDRLVLRMVELTDQHYEEMLDNIDVNVFETKNDSVRIRQYMDGLKKKCKPLTLWNRLLTKK